MKSYHLYFLSCTGVSVYISTILCDFQTFLTQITVKKDNLEATTLFNCVVRNVVNCIQHLKFVEKSPLAQDKRKVTLLHHDSNTHITKYV